MRSMPVTRTALPVAGMPTKPAADPMLQLDNQLCFALYSASLAMTKLYKPLLEELGQPLLATTLIPPGETEPLNDSEDIRARFEKQLQAIVCAGACPREPTTVVDLSDDEPVVIREGRGDPAVLGL